MARRILVRTNNQLLVPLWVVSSSVIQLSTRIYLVADGLELFLVAMWVSAAGQILLLAAMPFAWLTIRGVTQGVPQRSSVPVHSPVASGVSLQPRARTLGR